MRAVAAAFAPRLAAAATTLALCWRIVRRDGVAIGLTTHDRALVVGGMVYRAAPGLKPSAIALGPDEGHAMEIAAALSDDCVREDDLREGLYDGARVTSFLVDWDAPDAGMLAIVTGEIGGVSAQDGAFVAELRTAMDAWRAVPVERYSPTCRAELGDRRCRADLAGRTRTAFVTGVAGAAITTDDAVRPADTYRYGRARVLSGAAAGSERVVDGSAGGTATLRAGVDGLLPGARVELREGCDKRFATCRDRFGNQANFRGEPHVPGADALARYPGL